MHKWGGTRLYSKGYYRYLKFTSRVLVWQRSRNWPFGIIYSFMHEQKDMKHMECQGRHCSGTTGPPSHASLISSLSSHCPLSLLHGQLPPSLAHVMVSKPTVTSGLGLAALHLGRCSIYFIASYYYSLTSAFIDCIAFQSYSAPPHYIHAPHILGTFSLTNEK